MYVVNVHVPFVHTFDFDCVCVRARVCVCVCIPGGGRHQRPGGHDGETRAPAGKSPQLRPPQPAGAVCRMCSETASTVCKDCGGDFSSAGGLSQ